MSDEQPDTTWSYQPGDWFGVFGPDTTLLLPGSEKSRVVGLWELIDGGAGFDQVLDGLVASGLSSLPGFALIGSGSGTTKILLRGEARASVEAGGEKVELDGSAAATWTEHTVEGVTALTVTVGAADDDARRLAIGEGLVRVSRISHPETVVEAPAVPVVSNLPTGPPPAFPPGPPPPPVPPPPLVPPPPPPPPPSADALEESSPLDDDADTNAQPSPFAAVADEEPDAEPDVEATMMFEALDEAAPEPDAEPVARAVPDPLSDDLPDEEPPPLQSVGSWSPEGGFAQVPLPPVPPPAPSMASTPPAPPTPPPPPSAPADPDHDGMTRIGVDADEFARPQPGIPGQPQPPSVTRSVAKLLISNGDTVDVDRAVLIGRAPEARRFTSTDQPRLVTVPSPLHEISSTHVEVRPGSGADHGSAVVTDMGSTNGTVLVQPGLGPEELKPGIAVQLIPGAVINLGDGVTIQVTRP